MKFDKRIWKTAVLAIIVTMVFAVFVFRVEDWTKGLSTDFVVYGQTTVPGTGCTCTGTSTSTARIIPQVAVGSFDSNVTKYKTVIEIVNTGTTTATLSGGLYTQAGLPSTVVLNTNLTAPTTVDHVALAAGTLTLAAGRVIVLTAETAATGTVNWAKIAPSTGATIAVSAYFEIRDVATNVLYSRVGVAGSHSDMKKFVIPRLRNTATGTDVGFAIVNTSTATATITATLKDANGGTVAVKAQALTPGQQMAVFPTSFFALTNEPAGTNYHSMVFESSTSAIAATALAIEGASLASFAVERLE